MTEAIGGGEAPLPPKRPTIIRAQVQTSLTPDADGGVPVRPAPARPAPPPPVRPTPPQTKLPQHEQDDDGDRSPRRPTSTGDNSGSCRRPTSSGDNSLRSGGSVRKRPEITIVGARPMSQVGFRDEIQKNTNEHHTSPPMSKPPDIPPMRAPPPRPVSVGRPPLPSRPVDEDCNGSILTPTILPPPVPSHAPSSHQPLRPSRPKSLASGLSENKAIPPSRPPRSPIPSPAGRRHAEDSLMDISIQHYETIQDEQQPQPSRPSRPTIIRPKRSHTTEDKDVPGNVLFDATPSLIPLPADGGESFADDRVHDGGPSESVGPPVKPPIIKPHIIKPPLVKPHVQAHSDQNKTPEISDSATEPVYAVINKKRPTSITKPKISPREEKVELSTDAAPADDHALPFKVKLRSTLEKKPDDDATNRSDDVLSKPPPLAAKPKPLPRPKPAAKPSKQESWADKIKDFDSLISAPSSTKKNSPKITRNDSPRHTRKNTSPSTARKEISSTNTRKDISPTNIRQEIDSSSEKNCGAGTQKNDNEIEDYEKDSSGVMFPNQIVVKRPTIIRPPAKPARVSQEDVDKKVSVSDNSQLSPNSSDDTKAGPSRPGPPQTGPSRSGPPLTGPPLPAKRPVSQTAAMFELGNEVREEPKSKPQVLRKFDVKEKSENNISVLSASQNQGPKRPAQIPVPRTRKSPSEVKSVTDKPAPASEDKPTESTEVIVMPSSEAVVKPSTECVENESSTSDNIEQCSARPSGRPPPSKFSTTQKPLTKDTVTSDEMKGPPRPSGGPPRPAGPPPSPKASQPTRPSPPKSSGRKTTTKHPDLPSRPSPGHPLYHYMMTEPHGIAQFDYTATHDDELTFKLGDTVLLERRVDADWLVGKVGDRSGMFPAEFVDVVHPLHDEMSSEAQAEFVLPTPPSSYQTYEQTESYKTPQQTESYKTPQQTEFYAAVSSGPRCIARFDFEGEGVDDLTFEEDDVIRLVSTMGCDWMRGELKGKEGIFPIAFVDIIEPLPDDAYRPDSFFVTMEIDHVATEEQELSFKAGETVKLLGRLDSFWLIGETNTQEGKFPASLVTSPLPPELPDYEPPADLDQDQKPVKEDFSQELSSKDGRVFASQELSSTDGQFSSTVGQTFAMAVHSFSGEQDGDLAFQEGDKIELLEKVGQDWYKGRLDGREGMFPATFIDVQTDVPELSGPDSPVPVGYTAPDHPMNVTIEGKALFDFEGQGSEELKFKKGDMIELGQHVSDGSDWQYGTLHGKRGMFPASFVEIL